VSVSVPTLLDTKATSHIPRHCLLLYPFPSSLYPSCKPRIPQRWFEHYSLEFGTDTLQKFDRARIQVSTPAQIYVHWKCDVIFPINLYQNEYTMRDFGGHAKLRNLALEVCFAHFFQSLARKFNLEQIIFYLDQGYVDKSRFGNYDEFLINLLPWTALWVKI
jgi:hypothetical protein